MKFQVVRTSQWLSEKKSPCQEAIYDKEKEMWIIEFNTLNDLLSFTKENGDYIVLSTPTEDGEIPTVEIYDDYRE